MSNLFGPLIDVTSMSYLCVGGRLSRGVSEQRCEGPGSGGGSGVPRLQRESCWPTSRRGSVFVSGCRSVVRGWCRWVGRAAHGHGGRTGGGPATGLARRSASNRRTHLADASASRLLRGTNPIDERADWYRGAAAAHGRRPHAPAPRRHRTICDWSDVNCDSSSARLPTCAAN